MKVAIVGVGHVARHQMNAIQQFSGSIELVGAYDRDPNNLSRCSLSCQLYISLDQMIENSAADLVIVSTPNIDHFGTGLRLLSAGKAVMIEKPVCECRQHFNQLVEVANARNTFFHAAFHAAYARDLLWWAMNRDTLAHCHGPIERIRLDFADPYLDKGGFINGFAKGFGGSWFDSGINALSVIASICDIASASIVGGRMAKRSDVDDFQIAASAHLTCNIDGRGCTGTINTDWTLGIDRKVTTLIYKRAMIILDHSNERVIVKEDKNSPKVISLKNNLPRLTNHYVGVFEDLVRSFAKDKANVELSTRLHHLLFAAAEQAKGSNRLRGNVRNRRPAFL